MGTCCGKIGLLNFDPSKKMLLSHQNDIEGNLYNHKSFKAYYRVLHSYDFDDIDKFAEFLYLDLTSLYTLLVEKWRYLLPTLNFFFENKEQTLCNVIIVSYTEDKHVFGWQCYIAYDGTKTQIEKYINKSTRSLRNDIPLMDTPCNVLSGFGKHEFTTTMHGLFSATGNQVPFRSSLLWLAKCRDKRNSLKKQQKTKIKTQITLILTTLKLLYTLKSRLNSDVEKVQVTLTKQKDEFLKCSIGLLQQLLRDVIDCPHEIYHMEVNIFVQHIKFTKNLLGIFDDFRMAHKKFNDEAFTTFEEWNEVLKTITHKIVTLGYRMYDGMWCIVDDKAIRALAHTICVSKTNYKRLKDALNLDVENKHKIILRPTTNDADDILVYCADKVFPVNFTESQVYDLNGEENRSQSLHYYIASCSCNLDKKCAWICTRCKVFIRVLPNAKIACECGCCFPPDSMTCIANCGNNGENDDGTYVSNVNSSQNESNDRLNDFVETPQQLVPTPSTKQGTDKIEPEVYDTMRHLLDNISQHMATTDSGYANGTSIADTDTPLLSQDHCNETYLETALNREQQSISAEVTLPESSQTDDEQAIVEVTVKPVSQFDPLNLKPSVETVKATTPVQATSVATTFTPENVTVLQSSSNVSTGDGKPITQIVDPYSFLTKFNSTPLKTSNESSILPLDQPQCDTKPVQPTEEQHTVNQETPNGSQVLDNDFNISKTSVPTYTVVVAGASGAGKSTFLNTLYCMQKNGAFDNALKTENLDYLLPVKIEEYIDGETRVIEFGLHENENEEFSVGQSTTQRPKDYIVEYDDFKIRFIDTPGTNDTRNDGVLDQDKINIEMIRKHLLELDKIHAVVFVVKTTESKLTPDFANTISCMLEMLPRRALQNCCFVYTFSAVNPNFTPGPARQALSTFFDEFCDRHHLPPLELTTENQFCVDNEAFRNISIHRQGYGINDAERYRSSWDKTALHVDALLDRIKSLDPVTQKEFKCVKLLNELGTVMRQKLSLLEASSPQMRTIMATVAKTSLSGIAIFCQKSCDGARPIAKVDATIQFWDTEDVTVSVLLRELKPLLPE